MNNAFLTPNPAVEAAAQKSLAMLYAITIGYGIVYLLIILTAVIVGKALKDWLNAKTTTEILIQQEIQRDGLIAVERARKL